ncbi:hypothetical protein N7466_006591 [Penicillium verhagenii]|uniref:uncharacterized protein n=1 Tax=Penicillium verhagenii TaxID=1562060 RepID=UPI00254516F3|nr:uncharacterized protein N7466_006591 [Penicillium verhagenii]KAJ5931098.1 hypothetical protein N7466_006591 [Penicillium verhagenii]
MTSEFSQSQLTKYLTHLALPPKYDPYINSPTAFPKTKEALTTLYRCQITRFPYDNLTLHYTDTPVIDIAPLSIYDKFMGSGETPPTGRGGYCLECSIFFHHILLGLGFSVYMTGVRNRERVDGVPQGEFKGWTHIVNILELPCGTQYHIDVAFGGDGPTQPIPMISGSKNLGAQEVRLIYGNMDKQSRPTQKLWIYQYRNGSDKEWNSFYSFGEFEFFQDDFAIINRYTSWDTLTKNNHWIVKFIRAGETGDLPLLEGEGTADGIEEVGVVGKMMYVNGLVKLNMGGRTRVIDSFETDAERREGLKKWFDFSF